MSSNWVSTKLSDWDWNWKPEPYKYEPHRWAPLGHRKSRLPWSYCPKCGLVKLKTKATKLCMRLGCNYDVHKEYLAWRKNPRNYK